MALPLMPKATAVWLVENTTLTFEQIAEFCGMHALEVQAIADGEVAVGIVGLDPIANGQVTREEITKRASKTPISTSPLDRAGRGPQQARRAPATRRSPSARTSPTPSPGWSSIIPICRTRRSAS